MLNVTRLRSRGLTSRCELLPFAAPFPPFPCDASAVPFELPFELPIFEKHDKSHILLIRDLLTSAVDQMNARLTQTRPAMFQSLDDVKGVVDLAAFRPRFAGTDRDLAAEFDDMTTHLVKVVFQEASLR